MERGRRSAVRALASASSREKARTDRHCVKGAELNPLVSKAFALLPRPPFSGSGYSSASRIARAFVRQFGAGDLPKMCQNWQRSVAAERAGFGGAETYRQAKAIIEQETIRAVIKAYAAGTIKLSKPDKKSRADQVRNAPDFTPGCAHGSDAHPYTAETIQEFLGFKGDAGLNRIRVNCCGR